MSDSPPNRSRASLLFEAVLHAARRSGAMPRLNDIDFARLAHYAPWIVTIDPDPAAGTLEITQAGAGLAKLMGRENLIGLDYLELVDPAIKDGAFASVLQMMERPCGLWQMTPAVAADGVPMALEYTGYPVFDHVNGRSRILFLVYHPQIDGAPIPRPEQVQHSDVWCWLEMRADVAA